MKSRQSEAALSPIFRRLSMAGAFALITVIRPAPAQPETKSGYELIVAAANQIQWGDSKSNGGPSTTDTDLSPAENLRRERLAVARNAPALALLRFALQQPVELPLERRFDDPGYSPFSRFREMMRQLIQESDVRLADGDALGALDSRLTQFDFGASITRGAPAIDSLVGVAIEEMGRIRLQPVIAGLDAPQLRNALQQLKAIDARRASFGEVLGAQKRLEIRLVSDALLEFAKDETKQQKLGKHTKSPFREVSDADIQDALKLTQSEASAQITPFFDALTARSAASYQQALKIEVPKVPNTFIRVNTDYYATARVRFGYERNIVRSREVEAALELRAIKLETGAYPANFVAPIDPFSDNHPLIYHRNGDSYQLYSVGPDGKDDGAAPIQTIYTDDATGVSTTRNVLNPNSTGDILAPIF